MTNVVAELQDALRLVGDTMTSMSFMIWCISRITSVRTRVAWR